MAGIDIFKDLVKTAATEFSGVAKKIGSNMSVNGGIKGMQHSIFNKTMDNLASAESIAKKTIAESGDKATKEMLENASKISSSRSAMQKEWTNGKLNGMDYTQAHRNIVLRGGIKESRADLQMGKDLIKEYYTGGTAEQNKTRKYVTAGAGAFAAGVGAGAVRNASGGSMTENKYGERDIAGIPFL